MSSTSTEQTLPVGAMIEEFRVVRILGTGSFGVVYQCENTYLDETVAIKEYLPTELAARQPNGRIEPLSPSTVEPFGWALDRFLQEAKTLWDLGRPVRHPNIVRVTRFRKLNGSAYMFMEFEHGRPLSAILEQRGPLSFEELLAIVEPLLSGLQRVHASGILHRDIKPANILIRNDGSPVLIDFGSAKAVAQSGEQSVFATYTPLYAALEQHQDVGDQGPWTDIYGLGATLYRAVAGQPPRSASQRLLSDPQLPATEVARDRYPESFLRAIDQACSLQPQQRPQSVAEWRAQLLETTGSRLYEPTVVKPKRPARKEHSLGLTGSEALAPSASQNAAGGLAGLSKSTPTSPTNSRRRTQITLIGAVAVVSAAVLAWALLAPTDTAQDAGRSADIRLPPALPDRSVSADTYEALALDHYRSQEFEQSLKLVELGLAASPGDQRLAALRERVRSSQRAQSIAESAATAFDNEDLEGSLNLIDEGLREVPEYPDLLALREKVLKEQARLQSEQAARLLRQAQALGQRGKVDEALSLIAQGSILAENDTAFLALRNQLEEEKARQQAVAEREQAAAAQIAKIRKRLERGDLQGAAELLDNALALDANNPQLADLGETLKREQEARRQALITSLINRVRDALDSGAPSRALDLAEEGLAAAPDDGRLKQLRTIAADQVGREQARAHLEQAEAFARNGDLVEGLERIAQGLRIRPGDEALSALRVEIERELAKQTQIDQLIAKAQELRKHHDLDASLRQVEAGLNLWPDNQDLQQLQRALVEERTRQNALEAKRILERARALAEEDALEEAVKLLEEAASLTQDNSEISRELRHLTDDYLERLDERAQVAAMLAECNALLLDIETDLESVQRTAGCYQRVLQLDPSSQVAADGLARSVDRLVEVGIRGVSERNAELTKRAVSLLGKLAPEHPQRASIQHDLELLQRRLLPEMVALDGGCYLMGSPVDEPGREEDERSHQVCVEPFEIGKHEVTVEDFERFVNATGYRTDAERGIGGVAGCWALDRDVRDEPWSYRDWASWRKPNKYQQQVDDHPVSCVSWHDAQAYAKWLSDETGRSFRLPTEAEWEYAARAGSTGAHYWDDLSTSCRHANVADVGWKDGFDCHDGNEWTASIGQYAANPWGLHDIMGNLWEWTCSVYESQYSGKELRCSPEANSEPRAMRGGAWNSGETSVRSAYRNRFFPEARYNFVGFRLAQDPVAEAAKETPDADEARATSVSIAK